jgi:AcrR family transcriptional regulator
VFVTAELDKVADSRAALRQALVDAAERQIARAGLASLKARDLADAVGCALGMIYKLVPDLDALILAVNLRSLELLDAALGQAERLDASDSLAPGDGAGVKTLVRMALAYFDFAAANEPRWRAIFEHRMPEGQVVPEPHLAQHRRMFANVEEPLRELVPGLDDAAYVLLGRSLFSAVHGVVDLGLKEKLGAMPQPVLRRQTAAITAATARGLTLAALTKPQQKRRARS